MLKKQFVVFILLLLSLTVYAEVLPKDSSVVNSRFIGFLIPASGNMKQYTLEIARGSINDETNFKKNTFYTANLNSPSTIVEVPAFGTAYTWRIVYPKANPSNGIFHHFTTGKISSLDSSKMRLRVLKPAEAYKNAYIFLDANRALYDMNGEPVWYLPETPELSKDNNAPRDMKITPQHTITFLLGEDCYEVDFSGKILWKGPNSSTEHYHHEFTRLANGHYMTMGGEEAKIYTIDKPQANRSGLLVLTGEAAKTTKAPKGYTYFTTTQFAKVLEYDRAGKLLWTYHASEYFNHSDLYFHKGKDNKMDVTVHDNGFYFDEIKKELYLCVRDISRVIKVKYPTGKTLETFGPLYTPGAKQNRGGDFFCNQHNCRVSRDGHLYLFNNNACKWPDLPTVVMMSQPKNEVDSVKKIWEFKCTVDDMSENEQRKLVLWSGGSVEELPDKSLLVNMGGQYSKVFIVNRNKEIMWSALPETWNETVNKWLPCSQYRASIITSTDELNALIMESMRNR